MNTFAALQRTPRSQTWGFVLNCSDEGSFTTVKSSQYPATEPEFLEQYTDAEVLETPVVKKIGGLLTRRRHPHPHTT